MKIRTVLFLLLLPMVSVGQLQIGLTCGYSWYWFTHTHDNGSEPEYNYSPAAYYLTLSARQRSACTFNHGIAIEFTHRSFKVKSGWGGLGSHQWADFDYTIDNLYLHFQPQFTFGSKLKFFIYPGIYFGTLLHSNLTGTIGSFNMAPYYSGTDTLNGNATGYYPKFEFGLAPGLGMEYPVSPQVNLIFETSFNLNLTDISGNWGADKSKMLGVNVKLGAAYTFRSKKAKEKK
ncbi:MAG: hypothetical protein ACOYNC_09560 [Bacteroidales bacterium]